MPKRRPGIEDLLGSLSGTQGGLGPEAEQEAAPMGAGGPMPVGVGNTEQVGNPELASMTGGTEAGLAGPPEGMAPEPEPVEEEVQAMQAALQDPNTPPEVREQIQMQLAMAAKRNLAGLSG
jgi:hypothetical protein